MIYATFIQLMDFVILPLHVRNPTHIRIDGATTGGNWEIAGKFRHHDKDWKLHSDTHYEPLVIAYKTIKRDTSLDPFFEEPTKNGVSLNLKAELRPKGVLQQYKYIYIYEDIDRKN